MQRGTDPSGFLTGTIGDAHRLVIGSIILASNNVEISFLIAFLHAGQILYGIVRLEGESPVQITWCTPFANPGSSHNTSW